MVATVSRGGLREVSFTVQTIDCIACSPVFRRSLGRVKGVLEVKELPITNKIVVVFDGSLLNRNDLLREIMEISEKAGFGDRIIFHEKGDFELKGTLRHE